jgi:hypothetical protein
MTEDRNTNLTQQEWEKMEKEFLAGFYGYFEELKGTIDLLQKNKNDYFVRSQICLAFIAADTFSRLSIVFQGERDMEKMNRNNERRFKQWLDKYVFTLRNAEYKKHKDNLRINTDGAWKLRNSFIHFYSFPSEEKGQKRICFSFNRPSDECKRIEKELKKRIGKDIVFVDINNFINAIFEGLVLQFEEMVEMIKNDPDKYTDSVVFMHKIIREEGAKTLYTKQDKK